MGGKFGTELVIRKLTIQTHKQTKTIIRSRKKKNGVGKKRYSPPLSLSI